MTGDSLETARAIAEKCGIVVKGDSYLAIDSSEFNRRISDSDGEVSPTSISFLPFPPIHTPPHTPTHHIITHMTLARNIYVGSPLKVCV